MQPERLGSYLIDSELGRGGMGVVYRAHHERSGQVVAIKVLPAELARESGFAERFAHEVAALQKLDHPNIVKLIEPGEDQGYQFYVMEFVAGQGVDKLLTTERRLSWRRVIELGVQVCRALKHAHDSGVIHRDLKPANLLVADDGTLKLTDFGVAKLFAGTQLTATGSIIGTAEYMSPEQGEGKPVTRRSDLYSLGCVLYKMLTGRTPFIGQSLAEMVKQHRYGQFDRPIAMVPDIPTWLDDIVCQLLEKEPDKRPADAMVVLRRLESVLKKSELRESKTIADDDFTLATGIVDQPRRRGMGPATLMQRLMRAQLAEIDQPNWLGRIFQRTWVLVIALLAVIGSLLWFSASGGEARRWREITKLAASDDELDLAVLESNLRDYLKRYDSGPHAADAREMLPQVERDRARRGLTKSNVTKFLRPTAQAPSELERLYRKALVELWTAGESAARTTLDEIVSRRDSAGADGYIVELAQEDLLALDLQLAARLRDAGNAAEARTILEHIIADTANSPRLAKSHRAAREMLDALPPPAPASNGDDASGHR